MLTMNYFLLPNTNRPTIVHGPTGLKLYVYSLENEHFRPSKGELHIFGDDHGEPLAFETEGWDGAKPKLLPMPSYGMPFTSITLLWKLLSKTRDPNTS